MKKVCVLALSLVVFFTFSCKNESAIQEDSISVAPDYYPMAIGNYWVYNYYEVDSNGDEILILENDTVIVVGDTLIKGMQFFKISERLYATSKEKRIVYRTLQESQISDENNEPLLSYNDFNTKLAEEIKYQDEELLYEKYLVIEPFEGTVQLPSGNFDDVINRKTVMTGHLLQMPINPRILNSYYANGVGQLTYEYAYSQQNGYFIKKLVAYQIE